MNRSHSDHETGSVEQTVCRQNQVQGGKCIGANASCNKKGISKNVAGKADHSENIRRDIFQKK